jgi:hypothetical protein
MKRLYIFLIIIALASCNSQNNKNDRMKLKFTSNFDNCLLNDDITNKITEYVKTFSDYGSVFSFRLYKMDPYECTFILKPVYNESDFINGKPQFLMMVDGKKVFLECGLERILNDSIKHDSVFLHGLELRNDMDYKKWEKIKSQPYIVDYPIWGIIVLRSGKISVNKDIDTIIRPRKGN